MIIKSFLAALALLLFCSSPVNATQSGSVEHLRQQWSQAIDALKAFTVEQRDEAVANGEQALESLDREIGALEDEAQDSWHDLSQEARDKRRASLRKLRQARSAVAEWFGAMKHGSKEGWHDARDGFVENFNAAADSVQAGIEEIKIDAN